MVRVWREAHTILDIKPNVTNRPNSSLSSIQCSTVYRWGGMDGGFGVLEFRYRKLRIHMHAIPNLHYIAGDGIESRFTGSYSNDRQTTTLSSY